MDEDWVVPGYRHVRPLGEGAAGRVILAVHEATNTPVAIKYLSDRLRSDELFLGRFRAEARVLAGLDDPNLVRFFEYVEATGAAALVMELVDGVSLSEILKAEGGTGPEAALLVLQGSLRGLAAAHATGVVHRDYKPGNVLVRDDGRSKLADFGIAVRAGDETSAAGTPAYMAPEQWATGAVTPAADVYAATGVFYECLTGERPYPVKGLWALAAAHRTSPIPVHRVPEALRGLIAAGLAKDPADRPATAEDFLHHVEAAALREYGPGWEERGRARLAALAALLAYLFPLAKPLATGGTALALTRLGRARLAIVVGAAIGALAVGGGGAAVLAGVHKTTKSALGATSTPSAAPTVSDTPAPDGTDTPSPTPTITDGTSPTPVGPPVSESADPTLTSPGTTTSSPKAATTRPPTPPPSPTKASGLTVSMSSDGSTVLASGTVTVSGPGPVTVSARFSGPFGDSVTVRGAGRHSFTLSHTYDNCPKQVDITVTTSPPGPERSGTVFPRCSANG